MTKKGEQVGTFTQDISTADIITEGADSFIEINHGLKSL